MSLIDPTSRIATGAVIGADVQIGPYSVIGPSVTLGDGSRLGSHVSIAGRTKIGPRTVIHPFASIGGPPQSVHYRGEDTTLSIGADCDIREHVTINIGTAKGRGTTTVGDKCFLMTGAHVGHDCVVGNNVTFANNATLGGFCEIGDYVFLGGLSAVHQFARVGERAMIGGLVGATLDVIPYAIVVGDRGRLAGLNRVGLRRGGMSNEVIHAIHRAYKAIFFGPGTLAERTSRVAETQADNQYVMRMVEFIRTAKGRRVMTPRDTADGD